jgi:hypothetical protein
MLSVMMVMSTWYQYLAEKASIILHWNDAKGDKLPRVIAFEGFLPLMPIIVARKGVILGIAISEGLFLGRLAPCKMGNLPICDYPDKLPNKS